MVVVAAGNESQNASNSNPANCSGVITVAATNRSGGRASYSNYGTIVDVAGNALSTTNIATVGNPTGALIIDTTAPTISALVASGTGITALYARSQPDVPDKSVTPPSCPG